MSTNLSQHFSFSYLQICVPLSLQNLKAIDNGT
uniref:Uncharacterized protein n=1 Tax=Lotus japonicus TaxID=34305 RepID=I3SXC0_LOTJA|nr:unknown [Lotus japonicus]